MKFDMIQYFMFCFIIVQCMEVTVGLVCFFIGDNNHEDDIGLYAPGQRWLQQHHIMGRAAGYFFYLLVLFFSELFG